MRSRQLVAALLFVLTFEAFSPRASAQDPSRCIDRLTDAQIEYRLRFIETRFERGKRSARAWYYGWMSFAVVAAAVSWTRFGLADRDDRLTRDSQFMSGVGGLALIGQMSGMSMTPAFAPQRLARMPRDTPEQRREALIEATRLLRLSARRQRPPTRLIAHVAPGMAALVMGTYLVGRYHDEGTRLIVPATIAYAFPMIVAESRNLSQPMRAMRDYELYRTIACSDAYVPTPEEERDPLAEDDYEDGPSYEDDHALEEDEGDEPVGHEPEVSFGFGGSAFSFGLRF